LRSRETRRREKAGRKSTDDARLKQVNTILAEAKIDERNREIFAEAAIQYAPLMKRLADK